MQDLKRIFIHENGKRQSISSLATYLARSLDREQLMDAARMTDEARAQCRWIGYGIGKGVTHPEHELSVFAVPEDLICGLHGELVQGFTHIPVDSTPACYELDAPLGFNGFVRWVYFTDPKRQHDIFGVDWSLNLPRSGGVATSMTMIERIARIVIAHGIPRHTELVLLTADMCEPPVLEQWRRQRGLKTLEDWVALSKKLFAPRGGYCPRCGLDTFTFGRPMFCTRCGCRPEIINRRVGRNLATVMAW